MKYIDEYVTGVEQDIIKSKFQVRSEVDYVEKLKKKLKLAKTPFEEGRIKNDIELHTRILHSKMHDENVAKSKRPSKRMIKCFDDIREIENTNSVINDKYRELNKGKKDDQRIRKTVEEELIDYKVFKLNILNDFCWGPFMGNDFIEIVNGILNANNELQLDNHMRKMFMKYL